MLQDAGYWKSELSSILKDIYQNCETCLKFKKTPSRPITCLPLSLNFNDAVAMDLKVWKNGLYIFYLIDVFTRLTKAQFIKDKKPSTIIDRIMSMWIGGGLGIPKKFVDDNGGELN